MRLQETLARLRHRDESGITLIELVVAMMIMGLVSIIIFNVFQSTNQTAATVQAGVTSLATTQTATHQIAKDIRNAKVLKVSSDGTRLDVEKADGTCSAWVYSDGGLYSHSAANSATFSDSWFKSISGVSLVGSTKLFTASPNGTAYSFQLGSGVGGLSINGETFMRLSLTRVTSVCFGDSAPDPSGGSGTGPTTPPVVFYDISYSLAGGAASSNPDSYSASSAAITLTPPTRVGYTFAGWTGTGVSSATVNVTIPAGSTGDRTYTATWTANTIPTPPASTTSATYVRGSQWGGYYSVTLLVSSPQGNKGNPINWKVSWADPKATGVSNGSGMICTAASGIVTCVSGGYGASNFQWNQAVSVSANISTSDSSKAPANPVLTVQ